MKVLIYNNLTNKMETYNRNLNDPMPYSKDKYLTVKEFRGSSKSDTIWADRRAIEAFNKLRTLYGRPIKVGYAFKRITEGRTYRSITTLCRNCIWYSAKFKYRRER